MNKIKRFLTLSLAIAITVTGLTGCGLFEKEEEVVEVSYEQVPLDATQLQEGKIYVKDGDKFIECPQGTPTFTVKGSKIEKVDRTHTIMFGKDDQLIPTLYKDQELIYVTSTTPGVFCWERYEDEGYTLGVVNLQPTSTNKYSLKVNPLYLLQGSSLRTLMSEAGIQAEQEIIFNKVNDTTITGGNISPAGSILGLEQFEAYSVDLYKGSEYILLTNVQADTHVYNAFEVYTSAEYDYVETDYITIDIPENFMSGYYYLYGLGFFRYVDGSAADGLKDVNFNVPYYYTDSEGNEYTYDEINVNEKDPENQETATIDYSSTTSLDCSNAEMTIKIVYGPATTKINGKETEINDSEVGYPTATLVSPDGETYEFTQSINEENTLTCTVSAPRIGDWTTNLSNMNTRKFNITTSFASGHSNSLVHTGSGTQILTYYLPQSLVDGLFEITWENETRAATVTIKDPNGNKHETTFEEGYGFKKIEVGAATAGEYRIEITGDDLGRVICNVSEKQ